jgi:uncharacterized protein YcfJ
MPHNYIIKSTVCLTGLLTATMLVGCAGNSPQTNGALMGAGLGALAGQALGHDTDSTLIGAGVGALAGTVIGGQQEYENRRNNGYGTQSGQTTRSTRTRRILNPDGSYTTEGTETTESTETTDGYQGLP